MKTIFLFLIWMAQLSAYQDRFETQVKSHPAPRGGRPHIHWCTMCGADNRYAILKETIQIIEPFFDQIHIVDNGSTDDTRQLAKLSPKVSYKRIDNWDGNWARCYAESIQKVCKGEWFMFNDSDERPSSELLKNLRSIVNLANREQVNMFGVQSCHHFYDDNGHVSSNYKNVIAGPEFQKMIFLKREDMVIKAFGGHTGFHLVNPKIKDMRTINPKFFYNHYKSAASVRVSYFTHGFMFPTTFDGLKPYAEEILNVRKELGITSMKQLYEMLHKKQIPPKMEALIASWKNGTRDAKLIWELIIRDKCKYEHFTHCDQPCCAY